jgi:hypothetical protein
MGIETETEGVMPKLEVFQSEIQTFWPRVIHDPETLTHSAAIETVVLPRASGKKVLVWSRHWKICR